MTISDEAVEAAAKALYQFDHWGNRYDWPTEAELAEGRSIFDPSPTLAEYKADYIREAKQVLEAAAPFIVAQLVAVVERVEALADELVSEITDEIGAEEESLDQIRDEAAKRIRAAIKGEGQ